MWTIRKCRPFGLAALARLVCALVPLLLTAPAAAFSTASTYAGESALGGGGGRWFTGSPAEGYGCSVCHSAAEGQRTYPLSISGVPFRGYTPGTPYNVVLRWPEFEATWAALRPDPMAGVVVGETPNVGLLAEFVPENGQASGTVEIDTTPETGRVVCEKQRPNAKPRVGATLYQVRPGLDPIELQADAEGRLRCDANRLGQRCIIALGSCGAHEVQVTWTPPEDLSPGPIWFSAGLVATERYSRTPDGDSVYEFSAPLVPEGSPSDSYEAVLEGAPCRVSRPGASRGGAPGPGGGLSCVGVAALLLGFVRRRVRRSGARGRAGSGQPGTTWRRGDA